VSATEVLAGTRCTHCGLDAEATGTACRNDGARVFCCAGCRAAYGLIHAAGLGRYYGFADRAQPARGDADTRSAGHRYEEFDHAKFLDLHTRAAGAGLREVELFVEGVHCASCVWLVERLPLLVPGAVRSELDLPRARVRVTWDPAATTLSAIARALATLGYRPHPYRGARREERRRAEDRAMLARIGIAGALAGNVMMLAVALYAGWFGHIEAEYENYFRWVSLLLTAPAILGPGRVFFTSAWGALRARAVHMDVPIAIALFAGFARGAVNTVRGEGPIYFDGVATLVFLLLVGRFVQQRAQRAATDSTELVASLAPRTARLVVEGAAGDTGGGVREVPSEALLPGMTVEVRHGDAVPADGVVVEGESTVDASLLTGESRPVPLQPGDRAWAATIVRGPRVLVRVEQAGEETRVGRLAREVEVGASRRAPIVRAADRLAGAFVAVVLVLAAVTLAVWSRLDLRAAPDHAIAMLIVTCPCALALATPLAMTVAIGRAARAGILLQGGDALERLARPRTLVLDKTGTLTEGRLSLVAWSGDAAVARAVVAVERQARHPVADAFLEGLAPCSLGGPGHDAAATDVRVTPGGGVEGRVDGRHVVVGNPAFVRPRVASGGVPHADTAHTPVWVAIDGVLVATAAFADRIRPDARTTLDALRERGFRPMILSGDAPAVVDAVGDALGIGPDDRRGGVTPEGRLEAIEVLERDRGERVVMVGDGVNDAAAMARASVGIGVRGGAEACLAAADVFLARPGLAGLIAVVDGSARTMRLIRRGIALSLAYNVVGAGLTLAGRIDPLVAAILMPVSSLSVVLLAWRGRTFDPVQGVDAAATAAGVAVPEASLAARERAA
jgi:Cu2+-exporting ATPase